MSNHGFFALIICTLCKLTCLHLGQHCQLPQTYKVQWLAYFLSSLSAHQVNFYEVDHCQLSSNWTTPTFMKKWSSPHCKLSCCWSQSAPCCTCTSRTSPRIGQICLVYGLGFVFLEVSQNHVLFLFCSCAYLSHHDVVAAPERILVHLDRVQVRVRVAALSLRKDKDDEGNKKKQKKCPKEGWTLNNIDLIARAAVIVPNRQVWDRLWHLRVQVNFSDSRCIMSWCLFGLIN